MLNFPHERVDLLSSQQLQEETRTIHKRWERKAMSEDVHYKGKVRALDMSAGFAETVKQLVQKHKWDVPIGYSDLEVLQEHGDELYTVLHGIIYEFIEFIDVPDADVFNAHRNADGTIDFEVKYYSGGCGLSEAIENAIDSL